MPLVGPAAARAHMLSVITVTDAGHLPAIHDAAEMARSVSWSRLGESNPDLRITSSFVIAFTVLARDHPCTSQ